MDSTGVGIVNAIREECKMEGSVGATWGVSAVVISLCNQ